MQLLQCRQADKQTARPTDNRKTDMQADRQTDKQMDGRTDGQTDRQSQGQHLRKPSGRGPSLCCRSGGISLKWLCLLRMTRSRSLKLLLLYFLYLPKLAITSGSRALPQLAPPVASSHTASSWCRKVWSTWKRANILAHAGMTRQVPLALWLCRLSVSIYKSDRRTVVSCCQLLQDMFASTDILLFYS